MIEKEHSEGTKKLYPNEMSSRHRSAMRMEIAGHTTNDIAQELGFNVQRLSLIMNSPLYIEEKEKLERDVKREFVEAEGKKLSMDKTHQELQDNSEKAAKTLVGALDDVSSGSVRINAAKEILDRTGYVKEEKVRANVLVEPSQSLIDMLLRVKGGGCGKGRCPTSGGDEELITK